MKKKRRRKIKQRDRIKTKKKMILIMKMNKLTLKQIYHYKKHSSCVWLCSFFHFTSVTFSTPFTECWMVQNVLYTCMSIFVFTSSYLQHVYARFFKTIFYVNTQMLRYASMSWLHFQMMPKRCFYSW